MAFVRRAVLVTAGVTVGVSSASYFSATAPAPHHLQVEESTKRTVHVSSANGGVWRGVTSNTADHLQERAPSKATDPLKENRVNINSNSSQGNDEGDCNVVGALFDGLSWAMLRAAVRLRRLHTTLGGAGQSAACAAASPAPAASPEEAVETSEAATGAVNSTAFRTAPHKLKDRFLRYARRDAETGEYVQGLDDFVRCILLLPAPEPSNDVSLPSAPMPISQDPIDAAAAVPRPLTVESAPSLSAWMQRLPPAVRRRLTHFFTSVDLDGTNAINYAEFVVLFTLLSVRRPTLERAFHVFDLDDNGRLSEQEFCRLINTIMVDPAVQVTYSPDSTASVASRAGGSRRSERARQQHQHELSFELPSRLMRHLLFGPLPLHVGAPPGSMHYSDVGPPLTFVGLQDCAAGEGQAAAASTTTRWTSLLLRQLRRACAPVWRRDSAARFTTLGIVPASRVAALQDVARQDALLQTVSYETFLYRMDYLRWELRAIEFGIFDVDNKGTIAFEDCRLLLGRDRRRVEAGATAPGSRAALAAKQEDESGGVASSPEAPDGAVASLSSAEVTWQMYQKIFDIIKESDAILPALRLMLDSLPPVPEGTLRGGAIPDAELAAATQAVRAVVQQTVLRYNSKATTAAQGGGGQAEGESAHAAQDAADGDEADGGAAPSRTPDSPAQTRFNTEKFGLVSDSSHTAEQQQRSARRLQASLVRPTALTWQQFSQVLSAISSVPELTPRERLLLRALLDEDNSNSLTPEEFARLCNMKETFFAEQLPRFDEPRRNVVQQFFFCMQQLD